MKKIVGKIRVTENQVILGDPLYLEDTPKSESLYIFNGRVPSDGNLTGTFPNGDFPVIADKWDDFGPGRVVIVFDEQEFAEADPRYTECMDEVCVDSGVLSLLNKGLYEQWSSEDTNEVIGFKDKFLAIRQQQKENAAEGIAFEVGGDGMYPVFWWYGEEYQAVGLGLILRSDASPY